MKTFRLLLTAAFVAALGFAGTAQAGGDCFGGHSTKSVDSGQGGSSSIADGAAPETPIPSEGG